MVTATCSRQVTSCASRLHTWVLMRDDRAFYACDETRACSSEPWSDFVRPCGLHSNAFIELSPRSCSSNPSFDLVVC
jgi:hypothetical protein